MRISYDVLNNYEEAERRVRSLAFDGVTNPVDGITYPDIALVPTDIGGAIQQAIGFHFTPSEIRVQSQFARLSVEGVRAPHQVHNDRTMGDWTSLLYMCDEGGTDICTHATLGYGGQPDEGEELLSWQRDCNTPMAWNVDAFIPAQRNKLVIYPSDWMHRAQPLDGYGSKSGDTGRLVIVTFFSLGESNEPD